MDTREFEREMFLAAGLMPRQAGDQRIGRGEGGQYGGEEAHEDGKRSGRGGKHAGGGGGGEEMETGMFERELLVAAGRKGSSVRENVGLLHAKEWHAVSVREMVMRLTLIYYDALY
jgi:hypothetical protein